MSGTQRSVAGIVLCNQSVTGAALHPAARETQPATQINSYQQLPMMQAFWVLFGQLTVYISTGSRVYKETLKKRRLEKK